MELKLAQLHNRLLLAYVLIGPSWNWNCRTPLCCQSKCSFNRTFMELKQTDKRNLASCCLHVLIGPSWNWNIIRNIMPLKLRAVLIGPSWNWNFGHPRRSRIRPCFNRTFMELKQTDKIKPLNESRKFLTERHGI